jgi:hypothetical protein
MWTWCHAIQWFFTGFACLKTAVGHIWQSICLNASNAAAVLPAFWALRQKVMLAPFLWDWIDNNLNLLSNDRLWYMIWFPVLLNSNKLIFFYKITIVTALAYARKIIILCSSVIRL